MTMEINADIPKDVIANFQNAFERYHAELGNSMGTAIRRGLVMFFTSVRPQTLRAKKTIPAKDVEEYNGPGPKYITPKGRNQKSMRRYEVKRRDKTPKHTYVNVSPKVETLTEARRKWRGIKRWNLARKSWGLAMHQMFPSRANPEKMNKDAVVKSGLTEGYIKEYVTGPNPRVEALIVNRLDYIREATSDAALTEAMKRATNRINAVIDDIEKKAREKIGA